MQFKHVFLTLIVLFNFWVPCFAQEPTVLEHEGAVSSVAFSPVNPNLVASAGGHNIVKVWNLQNTTVKTLKGHTEVVNSVTFSPDGKWLVSGSDDATLKMWDISQWQNIETLEPITFRILFPVEQVAFSPDGKMLATAGRHVNLLDIVNQTEIATLPHDTWVWVMDYSRDGKYLATNDGGEPIVKVWDVHQKRIIKTLDEHTLEVNDVKFSPDTRTLATTAWGEIKLWDASDWELLGTLPVDVVACVDFSPDGKQLASGGWGEVALWSVESGEKIGTLPGHTDLIKTIAFSADGTTLASGGSEGTVRVYNIKTYLASQPPRHTVRLIYFLPSDRTPQPDIDAKMDTFIKTAQLAYAEIMDRHGFGGKTFKYETDANGKAVVYHVKGKFEDAYYTDDDWNVWTEIYEKFGASNIYLTALDIGSQALAGSEACGLGGDTGSHSGTALVPASGDCFNVDVIVHELGHAFGLPHDYRTNPKRVLSSYVGDEMIRSFCAAEWLNVHPYFNTGEGGTFFNEVTTFEILPSQAVLPNDVRLRFEVTDPDGLHQAQLLTPEFEGAGDLIACQRLNGTSSTVEFVVPQMIFRQSGEVTLRVIDRQGNFLSERFYPQAGPKIEGPWVWMIVPTGTDGSAAATSGIDYLAEASKGAVTEEQVATKGATAGNAVGNRVWTPGKIAPTGWDNITELVNTIGLGEGYIDNHVAYGSIALDSPGIQETRMYVGSGDAIKVWLNGILVHDNPIDYGIDDYREDFPVTLKQGTNILLVAVYVGFGDWKGFFGFDTDAEYTVLIPDATDPPTQIAEDVNGDGVINIQDLVQVASLFGETGENAADVNGDGVVNIQDLVLVAGVFGDAAAAPAAHHLSSLTPEAVQQWLVAAEKIPLTDAISRRGIAVLEHLLAALIPKETALLANYPNPFNPETWIPYQLSKPTDVTVTIYAANGQVVRTLALGHQPAGIYQTRSRAAHWDGRNALGEPVASGVYFYTLTAGEFTATRKMLIRK